MSAEATKNFRVWYSHPSNAVSLSVRQTLSDPDGLYEYDDAFTEIGYACIVFNEMTSQTKCSVQVTAFIDEEFAKNSAEKIGELMDSLKVAAVEAVDGEEMPVYVRIRKVDSLWKWDFSKDYA